MTTRCSDFIICSDASLTDKATAIATIFEGAEFSAESGRKELLMVVQQHRFQPHS